VIDVIGGLRHRALFEVDIRRSVSEVSGSTMKKRIVALVLLSLFATMTVACPIDACTSRYRMERAFFGEPVGTRVERLRGYDLPDQYGIFRYGMDRREPPDAELADPIAERGNTAVPFLLEQLAGTPDDKTVDDVLLVFEAMARLKTYDVHGDMDLMSTLTSRVSGMKDAFWRTEATRTLESIETVSKQPATVR